MPKTRKQQRLQGQPLSPGIAIGPLLLHAEHASVTLATPSAATEPTTPQREVERYRKALQQSRLDLQNLVKALIVKGAAEGVAILEAQEQMLSDPILTQQLEAHIHTQKLSAETLFCATIQQLEEHFRATAAFSPCSEPFTDLEDVASRVLRYLRNDQPTAWKDTPKGAVIYAKELSPSETIEALDSCPAAFLTERGGPMCHSAIIAKAAGVPYITQLPVSCLAQTATGTCIVVDATCGEVFIAPNATELSHYQELQTKWINKQLPLQEAETAPARTQDGELIRLSANMEIDSDLSLLHDHGCSGVGLLRSEHLISKCNRFPSEAEQFIYYRKMVKQMRGLPLVIRVFDVDEDQSLHITQAEKNQNPYLGWRAIRFLLRETKIFQTQLRALLRASVHGNIGIMFPLISGLQELREAKKQLKLVQEQLRSEGIPTADKIRVGCMIEVPSAALIADLLAQECDFFSIGTNDLIQYCLAVDRDNPSLHLHYTPAHPAIIRLLQQVIKAGITHRIPVTVCGEMGSDPLFTTLLIGLGIRELSVAPRHLARMKRAIRQIDMKAAEKLAHHVLSLSTSEEILECLQKANAALHATHEQPAHACVCS